MKRLLVLLLACVVFASMFAGCKKTQKKEGIDVGIILPTKQETRWLGDEAKFKKIIEEKGYNAEILFSQNSSATERTNVETLISLSAKVIVLCPYDATAAAAAANEAKKEGIKVISYDRLIMDTDAVDYYVTFDSRAVGAAQAKYLVEQAGDTKGNNLYIYSGALTDNNSFLFFEGAWKVLQPKIADGTFIVRNCPKAVELSNKPELTREEAASIMSTIDSEWSMEVCKSLAEAHLTANDASAKKICFVLGPADDDCARALSDAFYADAEVEKIFITGADGVEASVQYIIDGKQNMTVYKDPGALVQATMDIVDSILSGKEVKYDTTYNNNVKDVPSIQADVVTVTRDNIVEVFFEGGVYDGSKFTGWK